MSKNSILILLAAIAVGPLFSLQAGEPLTPDQGLKRLLDGNKRFVEGTAAHPHQGTAYRASLAGGQAPFVAVLTCADSRVSPELVFDQGLGDIFNCRVAGNIASTEQIGSLEYAVEHLHTKLIVVLGHEKCGAVKAAVDGGTAPGQIGSLVTAIAPAVKEAKEQPGDPISNAVRANVERTVKLLSVAEPILSEHVAKGHLKIVGALYDLATGTVRIIPVTPALTAVTAPAPVAPTPAVP